MSAPAGMAKAFAKALVDHLRGAVPEFTDFKLGPSGCDTCGFGASEYNVLDMDKLEKEIAEFASSFGKQADATGEEA